MDKKPLIGVLRLLNGSLEARLTPRIMHWISINHQNLINLQFYGLEKILNQENITYGEMSIQVQKFANVLKSLDVKKGDRVTIYLPMVPELPIAMLACARIGAIHTVIFSGFSATSIKDRVIDSNSKVIITADGGYRRGKIVPLKDVIDDAISELDFVEHVGGT